MSSLLTKKNLLRGSAWVFAGKLFTGIAQILIAMLLTRILSPEDFGAFQVVQRILMFLAIIGSFGMAFVIMRRVAEGLANSQPEDSVLYAKNIFLIVFTISAVLGCLFYAFGDNVVAGVFNIKIDDLLGVLVGLLFCLSIQQVIPEGFRGLHDLKYASIFSGVATNLLMLSILIVMYLWLTKGVYNLSDVIYVYFVSTLVVLGVSGMALFLRFKGMNNKNLVDGKTVVKNNLEEGATLTLANLLSFIVNQSDIWLVAAMFAIEDAAYYGVASRLVFVISAPVMVANGATRGVIADLWTRQDRNKLERLLRLVASLTVLVAMIPALLFILWGDEVLGILYGSAYQQAAGALAILVVGQLILLAAGPAGTLMILSGYQKQILYFDIISAAIFFLSAYYFGHEFGPVGIAVASALAISIKTILTAIFTKKHLNVRTYIGKVSFSESAL